jgi:hypothetical protein
MRFLSFYTPDPKATPAPPSAQHMAEMGELIDEMTNAGVLIATGAFLASTTGARVRSSEGKITVTEATAPKAGDRALGFALLQVKSKPEMFEMVERFLKVAGDGECELRVLMEPPEPGR